MLVSEVRSVGGMMRVGIDLQSNRECGLRNQCRFVEDCVFGGRLYHTISLFFHCSFAFTDYLWIILYFLLSFLTHRRHPCYSVPGLDEGGLESGLQLALRRQLAHCGGGDPGGGRTAQNQG